MSTSARVLLSTIQAPGHVNQALAVAMRLRDRGHGVWFHARPEFAGHAAAAGVTFVPMEHALSRVPWATEEGLEAAREELSTLIQTQKEHRAGRRLPLLLRVARRLDRTLNRGRGQAIATRVSGAIAAGIASAELMYIRPMIGLLHDYRAILDRFPADVLLVDGSCLGAMALHEQGGPPWATLGVVPLPLTSPELPPFNSGLPPATTALGRACYGILHRFWTRVGDQPAKAVLDRERERVGLPPLPPNTKLSDYLVSPFLHLQGTVPAFEYPRRALPPQVHFVGPFLPARPAAIDLPSWWPDLDDARAVVLVTQGTVHTDPKNLVLPALRGLADEDVLVVVTTPHRDALEPLPSNARVAPYIPYEALLPRVDVLVTNGGYTGVQMALAHGIPVVVAGTRGDELHNGALVSWLGAGCNLWTDRPTPELLTAAVRRALRDPTFRGNARRLQMEYAQYDGPTTAARLVEQLVRTGRPVTRCAATA
jgi:UDP:flavonoid glycosyltransferase YjiC (YdhE family)